MIKKIIIIFLLLFSNLTFSKEFNKSLEEEIVKKQKIIKKAFDENIFPEKGVVHADVLDADYFLELLNNSKLNLKGNVVVLVLPNVDILDKNIVNASKKLKGIKIFLLDKKSNEYKMENRSFEELKNKDKYEKLDNIKIIKIYARDELSKDIYLNSLIENNVINNSIYKKIGIIFGGEYNEF